MVDPLPRERRALALAVGELRARRRMTQEELAHAAGVSRNYVGVVERGEVNPTFKTLVLLSELMVVYERQADEQIWTAVHTT